MRSALLWSCLLIGGACAPGPDGADADPGHTPEGPEDDAPIPTLTPTAWLARASLDLRGVRPTLDELAAVEADPSVLPSLIEGFVAEERFALRVGALFAEVLHTRHEDPFVFVDYYEAEYSTGQLSRSIGEEPLQVLGEIARSDLSYREMVTGDWTMANPILADLWPVDFDPTADTVWQRTTYTDGRPAAGVLASNGMWWQFGSMENNLNRGRANQVSRIFLCADYLDLEVDFGTDQPLDSEEALGNAIRTDPNCTVCHDSLDPLASHLFGFWYFSDRKNAPYDQSIYHPEREQTWRSFDMPAPGFDGEATTGLAELGQRLAADPRYSRCFVEHTFEGLMRREVGSDDRAFVSEQVEAFEATDLRLQPLFAGFATSDAYARAEGEHSRKLMEPSLLSSALEDLTGYRMAEDGWDLLRAPFDGMFPLAGGVDGLHRHTPMPEPETTFLLVNKRFAEAAASRVVAHDLATDAEDRLLTRVDGSEAPDADEDLLVAQILDLHARILSRRVTEDHVDVQQELALWRELYDASGQASTAWTGVISLLLRDPDFVTY